MSKIIFFFGVMVLMALGSYLIALNVKKEQKSEEKNTPEKNPEAKKLSVKTVKKEMDIRKTLESGEYGERLKKFFRDDVEHIHIDVLEKVLKELISNDNINKTNHYKNNIKNGKWLCYDHENGKLLNELNYNDDIAYPSTVQFFEDYENVLKKEFEKKKNKNIENENGYNEIHSNTDEGLYVVDKYNKVNGKIHGSNERFSLASGNLISSTYFEDGIVNGPFQLFNTNGVLFQEGMIIDNKKHGICIQYYFDGEIENSATYKKGKKNGEFKTFYLNGNTHITGQYKEGKINGKETCYFESGELDFVVEFKNGIKHGKYKNYHKNGVLEEEGYFINGNLHGKNKIYFENGQLMIEQNIIDGDLDPNGIKNEYDKYGKLISSENYKDGKVVK